MGWRVDSGSFLAWIRAMMIEHDRETTSQYLQAMDAAGVTDYTGGSTTPEALAAGEVTVGFVNHYYIGRLLADQPTCRLMSPSLMAISARCSTSQARLSSIRATTKRWPATSFDTSWRVRARSSLSRPTASTP